MFNLARREPEAVTLREAMDRWFDEALTLPLSWGGTSFRPAVDLYQTDEEVVVKAVLPGCKAGDVQITIADNVLTLRGETREQNGNGQKDMAYYLREHRSGPFERSIELPVAVRSDKATAEFQDGILTVILPIAETTRPKTIRIKAR